MKQIYIFILLIVVSSVVGRSAFAGAEDRTGQVTYDLGAATGQSGGVTYTDINVGLNFFAADWLAWRNQLFKRFGNNMDDIYGLDTSLRLVGDLGDANGGVSIFVGPGYRFASGIDSSPFAEEGLTLHVRGLTIGGGAKQVFNSLVHKGDPDEMQYFVILGGGGRL